MSDTVTVKVLETWHLDYNIEEGAQARAEEKLRKKGCTVFRHLHVYCIDGPDRQVCVGYVVEPLKEGEQK